VGDQTTPMEHVFGDQHEQRHTRDDERRRGQQKAPRWCGGSAQNHRQGGAISPPRRTAAMRPERP
jgi:hypothetical protein